MNLSVFRVTAFVALLLITISCTKARSTAEAGTQEFRRRSHAGEHVSIYRHAAPELQKAISENEWVTLMETIRGKLGVWESSGPPTWNVLSGTGGRRVLLRYQSKFANGPASEEFVWRVEGGTALLVGYHISAPRLLQN